MMSNNMNIVLHVDKEVLNMENGIYIKRFMGLKK